MIANASQWQLISPIEVDASLHGKIVEIANKYFNKRPLGKVILLIHVWDNSEYIFY